MNHDSATDEQRAAWRAASLPEPEQGACITRGTGGHDWQPLSFVFETQLLDRDGRVNIRQPNTETGRVYCVCMRCHQHTYIVTRWAGFFLPDPWVEAEEDYDSGESVPESVT